MRKIRSGVAALLLAIANFAANAAFAQQSVYDDTDPTQAQEWRAISQREYGAELRPRLFGRFPLHEFYYDEQNVLIVRPADIFVGVYDQVETLFQIETGVEPSYFHSVGFVTAAKAFLRAHLGKVCAGCGNRKMVKYIDDAYHDAQGRLSKRYGATFDKKTRTAKLNLPPDQLANPTDKDLLVLRDYRVLVNANKPGFDALYRDRFAAWIRQNSARLRFLNPGYDDGPGLLGPAKADFLREIAAESEEIQGRYAQLRGWEVRRPTNMTLFLDENEARKLLGDESGRAIVREWSGNVVENSEPVMSFLFTDLRVESPKDYRSDIIDFKKLGITSPVVETAPQR